jgi:2-succinyl-5-enolpyruvyl-6-hydroxy-3-cyclohexene-1-carboxylate synthase
MPLTIGFTNNPAFECYSMCGRALCCFFGLGIAQQTKTSSIDCSSGSALLNYYPALAGLL